MSIPKRTDGVHDILVRKTISELARAMGFVGYPEVYSHLGRSLQY
jgi:hypothetical protein